MALVRIPLEASGIDENSFIYDQNGSEFIGVTVLIKESMAESGIGIGVLIVIDRIVLNSFDSGYNWSELDM